MENTNGTKESNGKQLMDAIQDFLVHPEYRKNAKEILLTVLHESAQSDCGWVSREDRSEFIETVGSVIILIDNLEKTFWKEAQQAKTN